MRVLVTGHSGSIGTRLVPELTDRGHEVTGLSLSGGGNGIACDLTDPEATARAVADAAPDSVIHLAGIGVDGIAWEDPARVLQANVAATWNLLEALDRSGAPERFVLGSSAAVYGRVEGTAAEDSPVAPVTPYGASKAAAEVLTGQAGRWRGFGTVSARLFNAIGPGVGPETVAGQVGRAVLEGARKGQARVRVEIRNPSHRRDFIDIRDTARALATLVEGGPDGPVNVCSGRCVSVAELAETIGRIGGVEVEPFGESRSPVGEVEALCGSNRLLSEGTGWEPGFDLERSAADLLEEPA